MSYQVLARKWRPKKFQDVIGQKHITQSLQNAILREQVGHAYLLSGTRGIGKTSIARLFAKALRCQKLTDDTNPCGSCDSCQDFETGTSMNVIEIDGASNNSVDNIRDLISNIHYSPTIGKYRIYIIDEVHMLSTNAFNALLKTLEEPPQHVIFILATTEPQKLLGTVLSRCQRFDFKNASIKDLAELLKKIAKEEEIYFESEKQIEHICREGKGSVRDTLSLLDQVLNYTPDRKINDEVLTYSLGVASRGVLNRLVSFILQGQAKEISSLLETLLVQNVSTKKLCFGILEHVFEVIKYVDAPEKLKKLELIDPELLEDISTAELFWVYETLAKDLSWALESLDPQRVMDICLQKVALRRDLYQADPVKKKRLNVTESIPEETREKSQEKSQEKTQAQAEPANEMVAEKPQIQAVDNDWDNFIEYVRKVSPPAAVNLEQGNLLHPVQRKSDSVDIELTFGPDQKIFHDYLSETSNRERMSLYASEFFQVQPGAVFFAFQLIDEQKKIEHGFMSKVEVREKEEEEQIKKRKNEFVSHPLIQEAEKIFNSKIDKIILDDKK